MQVRGILGVATVRCQSALPVDCEGVVAIDVACGCGVARWAAQPPQQTGETVRFERTSFQQLHEDAVSAIAPRPRSAVVATLSVAGEVCLWSHGAGASPRFALLSKTRVEKSGALELAWSDDGARIAVLSEFSGGSVSVLRASPDGRTLEACCVADGKFFYLSWLTDSSAVLACAQSAVSVIDADSGAVLRLEPIPGNAGLITSAAAARPEDRFWVFAREPHEAVVVDRETGAVRRTVDLLNGSRFPKAIALSRTTEAGIPELLYPTDRDAVRGTSLGGEEEDKAKPFVVPVLGSGSTFFLSSVMKHTSVLQSPFFWHVSASAISLVRLLQDGTWHCSTVEIAALTCCGLAFSPGNVSERLAVGDMAGNVFSWDWSRGTLDSSALQRTAVPASVSVRSLVWAPDGSDLLIGTLDGTVFAWNPSKGSSLRVVLALSGSITCMQFAPAQAEQIATLAVASTDGTLALATKAPSEEFLRVSMAFKAHKASAAGEPQDLRFGSLGRYAEIWSLAWAPDGQRLATCSEDQTTRIWTAGDGSHTKTLVGHTTAVTSVAWTTMGPAGMELLLTCADDQCCMVWNAATWDLLQRLSTAGEIETWHTLTYLAAEPRSGGTRVAVATQNGYVCVWDVFSGQRLAVHKIHTASIEGLCWKPSGLLATCSSDCSATLFSLF